MPSGIQELNYVNFIR